jgi:hypothetical protein
MLSMEKMKKGKIENASLVKGTLSKHQHREDRLCNTAAQQGQVVQHCCSTTASLHTERL